MSSWLFLCCLCLLPLAADFLDVGPATSVVTNSIRDVWESINVPSRNLQDYKKEIIEKLKSIFGQLSAVEGRLLASEKKMYWLINNLPRPIKIEKQLYPLLQSIYRIQELKAVVEDPDYNLFGIMDQNDPTEEQRKKGYTGNLLKTIVSNSSVSLLTKMNNLHRMVVLMDVMHTFDPRSCLFFQLLYFKDSEKSMCKVEVSISQLLSYLFSILQKAQLNAYALIQISWLMLQINNKGDFAKYAETLRGNYLKRMYQQAKCFQESMKHSDLGFWRCDPKSHVEGETYTEVTKLMQGVLINQMDLNTEKSCSKGCSAYQSTKQYGCTNNTFCSKQCKGDVVGCQAVEYTMEVCEAPANSNRRYDSITFKRREILSLKKSRHEPTTEVNSWWSWVYGECQYCFCYCDNKKDDQSVRYFNLRPVISNTANNRVVTGVKFVKKNRIIHLQIQQGELLPFGRINKTTLHWKPVEGYYIGYGDFIEGVDYHMLTGEKRAINLDNVKGKKGYILIGIRLAVVNDHLAITGLFEKFNFRKGKLIRSQTNDSWSVGSLPASHLNTPRTHLNLSGLDIPTRAAEASRIDTEPNQFVEFGPTDVNMDAGQSTIPFLDTQGVAPEPAMPLAGFGLYHKGGGDSGGFIGLKVSTYDFSEEIVENFLEIDEASPQLKY